jgi:acyl-CoA thioesterase YciA
MTDDRSSQDTSHRAARDRTAPDPILHNDPALRTIAMPADANPNGDIFGGWVIGQMDLAAGTVAYERARGRVATVAVDRIAFHQPVYIGDQLSCYAQIVQAGRTSIRVRVDAVARRHDTQQSVTVTQGTFTYVAIDSRGRPRPIPKTDG